MPFLLWAKMCYFFKLVTSGTIWISLKLYPNFKYVNLPQWQNANEKAINGVLAICLFRIDRSLGEMDFFVRGEPFLLWQRVIGCIGRPTRSCRLGWARWCRATCWGKHVPHPSPPRQFTCLRWSLLLSSGGNFFSCFDFWQIFCWDWSKIGIIYTIQKKNRKPSFFPLLPVGEGGGNYLYVVLPPTPVMLITL